MASHKKLCKRWLVSKRTPHISYTLLFKIIPFFFIHLDEFKQFLSMFNIARGLFCFAIEGNIVSTTVVLIYHFCICCRCNIIGLSEVLHSIKIYHRIRIYATHHFTKYSNTSCFKLYQKWFGLMVLIIFYLIVCL